ncbi:MAG: NAD(P)H-hydrate dehydratase [Lachnospiraceae bacterium]
MRYLPNGEAMKLADTKTIQEIGMSSMVLMERAALKSVSIMERKKVDLSNVLVVCGSGNNGGDGFAIARLLQLKGKKVTTVFVGNQTSCTKETAQQMQILRNYGFIIEHTIPQGEFSAIIDCIFGIGLSRPIKDQYYRIIEEINQKCSEKIAIDIPSGISAATGEVLGIAFQAHMTITFAFEKIGMVMYPGAQYTGTVMIADIGIPFHIFEENLDIFYTYDKEDLSKRMPQRTPDTHKGSYGKVLMVVGSKGMAGAAYLSSKAAYTVGAGLIIIYTHEDNRLILQQQLPEAIIRTYTVYDEAKLEELLEWADVTVIGPGIGENNLALQLLEGTLRMGTTPCVLDADGLNLLSKNKQLWEYIKFGNYVLTPHMKEMCRLLNCSMKELQNQRFESVLELAETYNITCVLKDARTCVASKNHHLYVNTSGNNAMAKGGSGDVLSGIIAGLFAQKLSSHYAATVGVYLHGLSGDYARTQKGNYGVLASDIVESISGVIIQSGEVDHYEKV